MSSWANLNKRQQTYLQAVFDVDQLQEVNIKAMATRGRWNSTPASEWRWMPYNASGAALFHPFCSFHNQMFEQCFLKRAFSANSWEWGLLFSILTM
jgi:hypothetical protein